MRERLRRGQRVRIVSSPRSEYEWLVGREGELATDETEEGRVEIFVASNYAVWHRDHVELLAPEERLH